MIEQTAQKPIASNLRTGVPLANYTWFQTGGPAAYFTAPTTASEFVQALAFAREQALPIFVLGKGANILISDAGFNGLVIHPQLTTITTVLQDEDTAEVTAGAGVGMDELIMYCLQQQLLGLEEFSGIPGTVGGSIYINLHYFEFLIEQFLAHAQVVERTTGLVTTVSPAWFKFGYNSSTLHDQNHYLLNATFRLKRSSALQAAFAQGRSQEIIRHRAQRYPRSHTCGSFFRNFHEQEVSMTTAAGKKLIFVAYYLDKVGVKGTLRIGGAAVSHQHANMLINTGHATTENLIAVARAMQQKVYEQFGVLPQPECELIGFTQYPLLRIDNGI